MNFACFGREMVNMDLVVFIRRNFTCRTMTDLYFDRNNYITVDASFDDVKQMLTEVQRAERQKAE